MAEHVMHWEIVRSVNERMISEFLHASFFSESELSMEGIVQSMIDGRCDSTGFALRAFVSEVHPEEYQSYMVARYGGNVDAGDQEWLCRAFVEDNDLWNEFESFRLDNEYRWNGEFRKDEVRERIANDKLYPLFDGMYYDDIYIYRDIDHYGIHLTRKTENE